MSHAITRGLAMAIAAAPFLIACGGGKAGDPGPINAPQCSGSSCGPQGAPATGTSAAALCPATADIVKSTYLGGAGSGEVVQLNIDATAMTYTLKWIKSPIPLTNADVTITREGTQITGAVIHPPTGALPTAEQTRCAFILGAGTGTASNGTTYTTPDYVNNPNPPMVLVGLGVAGGGIPGADVEYDGLTIAPLPGLENIGAVPARHFDFYPFLGFASTSTDLTKLAGTYNGLLYHLVPSGSYAATSTNTVETFDASGNCTGANAANSAFNPSASGCLTTGTAWTLNSGGYFDSQNAPQISTQLSLPTGKSGKVAAAHMVLGQINGATVPLVIRTGSVNLGSAVLLHADAKVDDESGIAMLAAATPLASGGFDGGYAGADSNFKSTATLIQGAVGTFINPSTSAAEDGFGLSYGLQSPGLVGVQDKAGNTGYAIASGGLYAITIQDTVNGGVATTSQLNGSSAGAPYFGIGAQISK